MAVICRCSGFTNENLHISRFVWILFWWSECWWCFCHLEASSESTSQRGELLNRFQRVCEEDDDNHISYNFYRHSFYADKIDHDVATPESGELLTRFQRVCKRPIYLAELRFPWRSIFRVGWNDPNQKRWQDTKFPIFHPTASLHWVSWSWYK